jgi:alanyl-tRNA synthetase
MINAHFSSSDNSTTTDSSKPNVFVAAVPLGPGSKTISEVLKHLSQKDKDKSVYLVGEEKGEGARVSHGCHVAESVTKKNPEVTASNWANAVAGVVGGKAGGKGATSVGNGTDTKKVEDGVEEARQWIEKSLSL